jgi:hypothetical protein
VYPGFLFSGFEEIGGLTKTGMLGSWTPLKGLTWDVLASFETDFKPYMDINLSSFLTYKAGPFEVGAGVEAQRLAEFNACSTSPKTDADVSDCLGGDVGSTYVGPGADYYKSRYFVVDSTGHGASVDSLDPVTLLPNPNYNPNFRDDTTSFSLAGTKVMVRGAVDFKQFLMPSYSGASRDMVLYFELALLGVKNYDYIYEKRSERMPVLVGLNVPTWGWLDLLSLEVEYYNAPFQNDPYKITGAYDVFSFSEGNSINYASSPIPGSNDAGWEHLKNTETDFDPSKDNWKWSVLAAKQVNDKITFKVQVASDHWRTPNNNQVKYEAMANPGQFYAAARVAFAL